MRIAGASGDAEVVAKEPKGNEGAFATGSTSPDLPLPLRRRSTPEYMHELPRSRRKHDPQGSLPSHLILEALQAKHARQDR